MAKRMTFMLLFVAILFGLIFGWLAVRMYLGKRFLAQYVPPPVTISTTVAQQEVWQERLPATGSLVAVNGVNIGAETSGLVRGIFFKSGGFVKQNDLLVHLDSRVEEAELRFNLAQLSLARLTADRDKSLLAKNAASKSSVDKSSAELEEALAHVAEMKARIEQKYIRAPFGGKIGIRKVNIGEYIAAGKSLVELQTLDPLYVDFSLPQQNLNDLKIGQTVRVFVDTYPDETFEGTLTAINAKISESTRTILLRATIPNKHLKLYPGMFVETEVVLPQQANVVVVPQTAIAYSLYGDSVFVVEKAQTSADSNTNEPSLIAVRKFVKVGERRGKYVSILDGLKPGEQVVTSGQLKLENKAAVTINNSVEL